MSPDSEGNEVWRFARYQPRLTGLYMDGDDFDATVFNNVLGALEGALYDGVITDVKIEKESNWAPNTAVVRAASGDWITLYIALGYIVTEDDVRAAEGLECAILVHATFQEVTGLARTEAARRGVRLVDVGADWGPSPEEREDPDLAETVRALTG